MTSVLCDSGPLIALAKLNRQHLLIDLWPAVQVTEAVYREVVVVGLSHGAPDALAVRLFWQQHHLPIVSVSDPMLAAYRPVIKLDPGEQSTLALALTLTDALVLLDDEDARGEARRLGLHVRGTLGILVEAHRRHVLNFAEAEFLISEIALRPDIWISAKLCEQVLRAISPA